MSTKRKYVDAGDIDLDQEEVRLADGTRLTEEKAAELGEEIAARGRPSLSGRGQHSPRVAFRLPPGLLAAAEKRADAEGKRLSELAREALEHYLAS
jgi:hypothetical protein